MFRRPMKLLKISTICSAVKFPKKRVLLVGRSDTKRSAKQPTAVYFKTSCGHGVCELPALINLKDPKKHEAKFMD